MANDVQSLVDLANQISEAFPAFEQKLDQLSDIVKNLGSSDAASHPEVAEAVSKLQTVLASINSDKDKINEQLNAANANGDQTAPVTGGDTTLPATGTDTTGADTTIPGQPAGVNPPDQTGGAVTTNNPDNNPAGQTGDTLSTSTPVEPTTPADQSPDNTSTTVPAIDPGTGLPVDQTPTQNS